MNDTRRIINDCVAQTKSRIAFWIRFVQSCKIKSFAEIGVYRGDFAADVLRECDSIERYYMLDPWCHLDNWNKPANVENQVFESYFNETKSKTDFAAVKRVFLRGTTTQMVDSIPDRELDLAYIDGDHTLKGISIDLIRIFPKIRSGGWIGGDDFSKTIWQHSTNFEPTLVFPFAVYFAEAVNAPIFALPNNQFLIEKTERFTFTDLTGKYHDLSLRNQLRPLQFFKRQLIQTFPFFRILLRK